ncbi:MAG: hypothetical protein ACOZB3_03760 [Calditrichota bacterium]
MDLRSHRIAPILFGLLLIVCGGLFAADLSLSGGDVSMTISAAVAGQQPTGVTDETTQLQWVTLISDPTKKIVAQSNLGTPNFTLSVTAVSISAGDGSSAGIVTLGSTPTDLIVDIPADVPAGDPGTCTLRYAASAVAGDGSGSDVHTVTFTIMDQ